MSDPREGVATIRAECPNGHAQEVRIGPVTREWAELYCGILDGTSPAYLHPPAADPLSSIGKCCTCLKDFKARVAAWEPLVSEPPGALKLPDEMAGAPVKWGPGGGPASDWKFGLPEALAGEPSPANRANAAQKAPKIDPLEGPEWAVRERYCDKLERAARAAGLHTCVVKGCARCGGDHEIGFRPLDNPPDEWDWWGICPGTGQPVYMRFTPDDMATAAPEEEEVRRVLAEAREQLRPQIEAERAGERRGLIHTHLGGRDFNCPACRAEDSAGEKAAPAKVESLPPEVRAASDLYAEAVALERQLAKAGPAISPPADPPQPWTTTERGPVEVTTTDGRPPAEGMLHGPAPQPVNPATGQHGAYWVLSEAERAKGFVRPVRRSYRHLKCGTVTKMGQALAETYAAKPSFYSSTFCCGCGAHYPVGEKGEFVWVDDESKVGT